MPGVPGINERPASVHSAQNAPTQQRKVVVHHRSDALMSEQIENVAKMQESLHEAISALPECTTQQETELCQARVNDLKNRTDQMMLILKIVDKINRELAYSRMTLQHALKTNGDITTARKRVNWLEDRMENLLGRKRQRSDLQNTTPLPVTRSIALPQDLMAEESSYGDTLTTASSDVVLHSLPEEGQGDAARVVKDKTEKPGKEGDGKRELTFTTEYPASDSTSQDGTVEVEKNKVMNVKDMETESAHEDDVSETARSSPDEKQRAVQAQLDHLPAFLTETTQVSVTSKGSRVTIVTPSEELLLSKQQSELQEEENGEDEVDKYWKSEHHRFAFSEHQDSLLENDPLSYHQVGLAVPGTYVKPVETDSQLPWRPKSKESDITDIHQEALNHLSDRLHKMYDKVHDAAMLSVDSHYLDKVDTGPKLLHKLEHERGPLSAGTTVKASMTNVGLARPSSQATITFPPLTKERLGSSYSERLIYRPNPLPYPEKLPQTKKKKVPTATLR